MPVPLLLAELEGEVEDAEGAEVLEEPEPEEEAEPEEELVAGTPVVVPEIEGEVEEPLVEEAAEVVLEVASCSVTVKLLVWAKISELLAMLKITKV